MADEDLSRLTIDKTRQASGPRKRRRVYRWLLLLLPIAAVFLFFEGLFTPAVKVEVTTVAKTYPAQTFTLLNASGYVVAQRKAAVASKVTGRLISLSVEEGSRIKKGDVIARLESDDIAAARAQAAANLNVARHNLEEAKAELHDAKLTIDRNRELVAKGFISRSDYDSSDARYRKAVAAVEAAQSAIKANMAALKSTDVSMEYTLIRAPFDAVVLTKNADIGDIVTPIGAAANVQAAVVTVADMNSLQVEVDVSESNLEQVRKGQPCEIQLDAFPESRFRGIVHMIVPTADRTKATVLVKVRFVDSDRRVLPEMSAKVAFLSRPLEPGEEKARTAVNARAIVERGGRKTVFAIRDGRAVATPVTVSQSLGDMVEITEGVKAGDKVILKPLDKVKDGTKITISEG